MSSTSAFSGDQDSAIQKLMNWIVCIGIDGAGFLPSAEKNAADHLRGNKFDVEASINSAIAWSTAYASGSGFVTGLGGITTLPVTLPAGLVASYALGANLAATIAVLRGYDIRSEQVRTFVLLALLGEGAAEVLKTAGVAIGLKLTKSLIKQVPGKVLIEINKKLGFRLITKAGEKGIINLTKCVPIIGGLVGAGFDGVFVNQCGNIAKRSFSEI